MAVPTAAEYFFDRTGAPDQSRECEFFSSLKMRNGTFKLTRPSRFSEVEAELRTALGSRARDLRQALDVGASIGSTTIELADYLEQLGARAEVIGTDLFVEAHLVELSPRLRVLSNSEGWPLQYDIGGRAVRAWIRRLDYITLGFLPRLLARLLLRSELRTRIAQGRTRPVKMESRALRSRGIRIVENDIFETTPAFVGQFDFIRAANILNLGYFKREEISRAVANIRGYCRGPGALFLVLRSNGLAHAGTLFELAHDGRFLVQARIGAGSEIEQLVQELDNGAALDYSCTE